MAAVKRIEIVDGITMSVWESLCPECGELCEFRIRTDLDDYISVSMLCPACTQTKADAFQALLASKGLDRVKEELETVYSMNPEDLEEFTEEQIPEMAARFSHFQVAQ